MDLSDEDKALIRDHLDRGEPLPERFRWLLFAEPREAELIWPGKTGEVTNVVLPFQSIEQIDEPRAEGHGHFGDLFSMGAGGRQGGGWSNKLIWGDNKLVLASLKGGPLRREIEAAGGLKLVYIDPPFDVGGDFSFIVEVGDEELTKEASVIEEIAYRDTWGRGRDSYFSMIAERLALIHSIMSDDSTILVHCDWRVDAGMRHILDEVFGESGFRNEIVWHYENKLGTGWSAKTFDTRHDIMIRYSRGKIYTHNPILEKTKVNKLQPVTKKIDGERVWLRNEDGSRMYTEGGTERPVGDVWTIPIINPVASERLDYPTQKPEALLERVIESCSNPGDLVADFFCGSGTTLAVAEKLGRKWIGADLGRFAIHTSRKRLIGVQRELKAAGKPWRSFEILNLGHYERQWFAGINPNLPAEQRREAASRAEDAYVSLILEAYRASPVEQTPPFHGHKDGAFVLVGPLDAPVTEGTVQQAVDAARQSGAAKVDVLGFEFEMGLPPRVVDEARAKGVALSLRFIPKDVFDRRAVDKGQVTFHDLAYVEAKVAVHSKRERSVTVSLTDFGVSYRQDGLDNLIDGMKPGSKVAVEEGQVVKIAKAKDGAVTREVLTKEWTDWIDYWAVDFDYASRPETIHETVTQADGSVKHVPQWTGRYIFENEWQSFRTRKDRTLELTSAVHAYDTPGRKQVAVKVIDIFGNDTTKVFGVEV